MPLSRIPAVAINLTHGRIGATSWIFSGAIGTPSLHLPLERCWRVLPSAYLQSVPW